MAGAARQALAVWGHPACPGAAPRRPAPTRPCAAQAGPAQASVGPLNRHAMGPPQSVAGGPQAAPPTAVARADPAQASNVLALPGLSSSSPARSRGGATAPPQPPPGPVPPLAATPRVLQARQGPAAAPHGGRAEPVWAGVQQSGQPHAHRRVCSYAEVPPPLLFPALQVQSAAELQHLLACHQRRLIVAHFAAAGCPADGALAPRLRDAAAARPDALFLRMTVRPGESLVRGLHLGTLPCTLLLRGHQMLARVEAGDGTPAAAAAAAAAALDAALDAAEALAA